MSQDTLRCTADLVDAGLVPEQRHVELERVAARYAVAITPAMAGLMEPGEPSDPIARQFVPDSAELEHAAGERDDPIGDDAHSPCDGIVHRYPDRVLLQAHACLCRLLPVLLSPRAVGPARPRMLSARAQSRALAYIADRPRDLGGHPVAAAIRSSLSDRRLGDIDEAARGNRARQDRRDSHPSAGGRAGADRRRHSSTRSRPTARRPTWCCMPIMRAS